MMPEIDIDINRSDGNFVYGTKHTEILLTGTIIDRFGYETGKFAWADGVPFAKRSQEPAKYIDPYCRYKVIKPLEVNAGLTFPWFNQVGLGLLYDLKYSIEYLICEGYLERQQ
jgi:hypothetical protein